MSDLSIELQLTEKSNAFPDEDTSLNQVVLKTLDAFEAKMSWKINSFMVGFKLK